MRQPEQTSSDAPGLYRVTVRAHLDDNRLSAPLNRYLRVLG
jgi:hypothetical protein